MEQTQPTRSNKPLALVRAGGKSIILFDGVCNLCNTAVDFIIRRDARGRFLFASLQSEAGQELLHYYNLPTYQFDSMVLIKNNTLYQRSSAALEIAGDLPGIWSWFSFFKILPAPMRDAVYDVVARNRFRFWGKKESCRLPTPEERTRFLG